MNYLYVFINTILIWKDGTRRPVTCPAQFNGGQTIMKQHQNTGKSVSEALILESVNPQYDKRLFIEFPPKIQV